MKRIFFLLMFIGSLSSFAGAPKLLCDYSVSDLNEMVVKEFNNGLTEVSKPSMESNKHTNVSDICVLVSEKLNGEKSGRSIILCDDRDDLNEKISEAYLQGYKKISSPSTQRYTHCVTVTRER